MSKRILVVEETWGPGELLVAGGIGVGVLYAFFIALKSVFYDGPIALYHVLAGWREHPLPYSLVAAWYYFMLIKVPILWAAPIGLLWNLARFVSTPYPHINDLLNLIFAIIAVLAYIGGTIGLTIYGLRFLVRRVGNERAQQCLVIAFLGPGLLLALWEVVVFLWGLIAGCFAYLFERHLAGSTQAGTGLIAR